MPDASRLAERLYNYGRHPLSPRLRRIFPSREAIRDWLFNDQESVRKLLAAGWRRRRFTGQGEGWALWLRPGEEARASPGPCKLYVSPSFDCFPRAFEAVAAAVTESHAVGFKLGADLPFLVRPDKLVVYLPDLDETIRLGELLEAELVGLRPHGVPLTCVLGESGIVSWGVDPPDGAAKQQSWRAWLTRRLAEAMLEGAVEDRVGRALRRAEALGVDPVSWEPRNVVWRADETD